MFDEPLYRAIIAAAIWILVATIVALGPRRYHKPCALTLLALLIPLLPYLWIAGNPFIAIMFVIGVGSIMRWPLYYISRMAARRIGIHIQRDKFERSGYQMTDDGRNIERSGHETS